jgi:hypothetical protein
MASTPLYKSLKANGTSFYAFPGAQEDISAAYQNSNYKMYFSKYVLLNFPKQNEIAGLQNDPVYFDFENSFERSPIATPATSFKDAIIESLRNYIANHEVVMRESRLNNTKYYYDTNVLETVTEKVFWKWCKKLNLIGFEPASPDDEYFPELPEFASNDVNADDYFPEILWKEREVTPYDALSFYETANPLHPQKLEIEFSGTTNFKVGDLVNIYNVIDTDIIDGINAYAPPPFGPLPGPNGDNAGYDLTLGVNTTVLNITPAGATQGQLIVFDLKFTSTVPTGGNSTGEAYGKVELVYHRLIQYIGEVNGVSNVQEANRSYTEVYAHIPDHTGRTPDILFRTDVDPNYKPNLTLPILPSQYQPEILGAELFNSPIVSSPQNYPGSYYGQFDTPDYTYETAPGDDLRRTGDYFGVSGDVQNPVRDGSTIDGINIDFDRSHYVKMNIPRKPITNFDQFNAQPTNGQPPKSFEFNAILWYYTVEDSTGTVRTNLYGISFLDNPDNNTLEEEVGLRFPSYKKLVSNGQQDGTSYSFNLNLNFNIINENTNLAYNPESINSLFSMNLFNESMRRLASVNDSFQNIISEQQVINQEIMDLKGLLYTQTDINVLNTKIQNLENLLRLYSTMQIRSSESISVETLPGNPPSLALFNIDTYYRDVDTVQTSSMYSELGSIPYIVGVPSNKNFLLNVINNDEVELELPNNDKLVVTIDSDLSLRQVMDMYIYPSDFASQNKKLDIYMRSDYTGSVTDALILGNIDLPVSYNPGLQLPNSSYLWKEFSFDIDFNQEMSYVDGDLLEIPIEGNTEIMYNSIKPGDVLYLNNLFVGTSSVYDFSGQYVVDSLLSPTSSYIYLDVSTNKDFVAYGSSQSLPFPLHGSTASSSLLSNKPYFSFNKGKKIRIIRISNSNILSERYYIEVSDIM